MKEMPLQMSYFYWTKQRDRLIDALSIFFIQLVKIITVNIILCLNILNCVEREIQKKITIIN